MRKILIGILLTAFLFFVGCNDLNEKYNDDSTGKKEESLIEKPETGDSSEEDNSSAEDDKDNDWSSDY